MTSESLLQKLRYTNYQTSVITTTLATSGQGRQNSNFNERDIFRSCNGQQVLAK